jgi:hypothetical protein
MQFLMTVNINSVDRILSFGSKPNNSAEEQGSIIWCSQFVLGRGLWKGDAGRLGSRVGTVFEISVIGYKMHRSGTTRVCLALGSYQAHQPIL